MPFTKSLGPTYAVREQFLGEALFGRTGKVLATRDVKEDIIKIGLTSALFPGAPTR